MSIRRESGDAPGLSSKWFLCNPATLRTRLGSPSGICQISNAPGGQHPFRADMPCGIRFICVKAEEFPVSWSVKNIAAAEDCVRDEFSPVRQGIDTLFSQFLHSITFYFALTSSYFLFTNQ